MLKSLSQATSALRLLRSRNLQLIYSSSIMMVMGTSLIYPIVPVILQSFDVPKAQIGLVLSAFSFPAIFMAPVAGFVADLWGRKWVIVMGLLLYGIAGFAISLVHHFPLLLFLRVIQGVGFSGVMPLVVVFIGDSYEKEHETAAQGMKIFMDRIAILCLPPLAGLLGAIAWQIPFLLYGLTMPLAFCVLRWLPEPKVTRHGKPSVYFKDVLAKASQLRSLVIFSMSSLRFFLEYGFFTYLPIFALYSLGVSVAKGGFLFTLYAVGAMVTASQMRPLVLRWERTILMIVSFSVEGLCLLTIPLARSFWCLGAFMFCFGLADGVISPVQKSLLTQSAPGGLRGGVVSVDRVLQSVCKTVSPLIAGLILAASSVEAVFLILGAIALLWVLCVLMLQMRGDLRPVRAD